MIKQKNTIKVKKLAYEKKPRFGIIPKNNMSKIGKCIPFILIIVSYVIFFFILRGKFLFTPDYSSTDAFHFNISLKSYLAYSLKNNQIPFWTDKLQLGFPLFAEGQIGTFFLPNIVILKFLPFIDGYNLLLIFSLFLLTFGFYVLLIELKVNKWIALIMSYIFVFNGSISFRWMHINLIQSFSLTPVLFFSLLRFYKTHKYLYGFVIAFLVSQMIFAGHFQTVFISLFGFILWFVFFLKGRENKQIAKVISIILFFIFSGFIIALPQLIPTYNLLHFSYRPLFSFEFAVSLPLTLKHLISFFVPFPFGNPQYATYPRYSSSWGIFWENTPYLGPFFIFLFILVIYYFISKKLYKYNLNYYLILILVFICLSLGKDSPIYFIFGIFPFSMFRTPSKFLLMTNFFLILFVSIILSKVWETKKLYLKFVIVFVCLLNLIGLIYIIFSYHLFIDAKALMNMKLFSTYITKNDTLMNIKTSDLWQKQFRYRGWQNEQDIQKYVYFNNSLEPNSHLIYLYKNIAFNTGGLALNRLNFIYSLLFYRINESDSQTYTATTDFLRLTDLYNISKIISSVKIQNLNLIKEISDNTKQNNLFLYSVKDQILSDIYVPNTIININFKSDLVNAAFDNISTKSALVENFKSFEQDEKSLTKLRFLKSNDTTYKIKVNLKTNLFIVFKRNWYPEWTIEIDGKKIDYIQTNLIHMGVMVPKGEHIVMLYYRPIYFWYGLFGSITFFTVISIFYLIRKYKVKN